MRTAPGTTAAGAAMPTSMPAPARHRYSCVVDAASVFQYQAYTLVSSLLDCAQVPAADIVVHAVAPPASDFTAWLRERGVAVVEVPRHRHAYCNKLQQLASFAGQSDGTIVLLDCDTFVTRSAAWPTPAAVAAKQVDSARPPAGVLEQLVVEAGLAPRWTESDLVDGPDGSRVTLEGNCNGGVYVIAAPVLPALAEAWLRWADWCLARAERFGEWAMHIDQVSFALALHELKLPLEHLPRAFNCPTHIALTGDADVDPVVLHYHRRLDTQLFLQPAGSPRVDTAIARANERMAAWRDTFLPNALWFGTRYQLYPELGSGVGSAGAVLEGKRALLRQLTETLPQASVLEVGCGNLAVSNVLPNADYLGLDAAPAAVAQARAVRPDWKFAVGNVQDATLDLAPRDVTICLDVLIHQATRADYDGMLARLAALTGELAIVSGYDAPPLFDSSITYFHEALSLSLRRIGFDDVIAVAGYRDVIVFVAQRSARGPLFSQLALLADDPLAYWRIAQLARCIGVEARDGAQRLADAWIARHTADLDGRIALALDPRGSVLARWLAERGAAVAQARLEGSLASLVDAGTPAPDDPRILPLPVSAEGFAVDARFDVVVCTDFLEHLTPAQRLRWLNCLATHSAPGARLLLAAAVLPFTEQLWSARCAAPAGDVSALCEMLAAAGWRVVSSQLRAQVPQSAYGLALIEAHAR